jgi:small subunit ribosomal protein S5
MSEINTNNPDTEAVATAEVVPTTTTETSAPTAPARSFPPRGAAGARRRAPGGNRPGGSREGGRGGRAPRSERVKPEFDQKILDIRRVVRVVSGGRRFSFSVSIAIGDRNGRVGLGSGKSSDTSLAIEKAIKDAKKKMITLKLNKNHSIPHDLSAKFASSKIFMMPNKSRGLIAGSSARVILNLAGVKDVTAKFFSGSKNKMNNGK